MLENAAMSLITTIEELIQHKMLSIYPKPYVLYNVVFTLGKGVDITGVAKESDIWDTDASLKLERLKRCTDPMLPIVCVVDIHGHQCLIIFSMYTVVEHLWRPRPDRVIRMCSRVECSKAEGQGKFKHCEICLISYCSKECQVLDWKHHKELCRSDISYYSHVVRWMHRKEPPTDGRFAEHLREFLRSDEMIEYMYKTGKDTECLLHIRLSL
jgi:hypothetical protein